MATTTFMNLSLPDPSITLGPTWATQLNAAFATVDSHDHSNGKGTTVKTAGITINSALTFNNFSATNLKSAQFQTQASPLSGTINSQSVWSINGDLYYTNNTGAAVQITSGGALVPSSGSAETFAYASVNSDADLSNIIYANKVAIAVSSSSTGITITLPPAGSVTAGRVYAINDFTGNSETYPITIVPVGLDVINNETTATIDSNFATMFLISDGSDRWTTV